jgi:tetratricopeptide (TPR) repeat protein
MDIDDADFQKIDELVRRAIDEDDDERRGRIADEMIEIDPDNPIAKYIKWQLLDDDESLSNINMLYEARERLRPRIEITDDSEDDVDEDLYSLYVAMLSDLASALYFSGKRDDAFEMAGEFMELDRDCHGVGRMIYYAILVERKEFATVIEAADSDVCQTPMGEFCRAIAMFEMNGLSGDDAVNAILDAFELEPDLPFYILDLWAIDDSEIDSDENYDAYIEEMMMTASMLAELWSEYEERLAFITAMTFAFGYLTGRTEDIDDADMIEDAYKNIGCLDKMRETRDALRAMTAAGSDQSDVDEEALAALRDAENLGLFDFRR